jgi:predicted peptidase
MNRCVEIYEGMQYLITFPDGYEEGKKYPLIFLLHGAGSRGSKIEAIKDNKFYEYIKDIKNFSFVVVAPLCDANTWFDIYEKLKRFILDVSNEEFVNKDKIYAMGASMGGYTVWQLGMSMPEHFAAIVPICGGGMYWNARRFINLPVWAFHGELDGAVKVEESIKMVSAINAIGGNAKLTIYENTGHDAWTATYKNQEVYNWLLSISNDNSKEIKDPYIDPIKF